MQGKGIENKDDKAQTEDADEEEDCGEGVCDVGDWGRVLDDRAGEAEEGIL